MSARQLKRLQKANNDTRAHSDDGEEEEDDELVSTRQLKPHQSIFAALHCDDEDDEDDDEVNEENEGNDDDNKSGKKNEGTPVSSESQLTATKKPAAKKKKNKNKKKKKQPTNVSLEETELFHSSASVGRVNGKQKAAHSGLDEIDRARLELGLNNIPSHADTVASAQPCGNSSLNQLLKIDLSNLRVAKEMKARFGKDVVAAVEADNNSSGRANGLPDMGLEAAFRAGPNNGLRQVMINHNHFIQGKKTWPMASTGGLAMKQVGDAKEFAFTHNQEYNDLETALFSKLHMFHPDLLVAFVHQNPYHVAGLILISKLAMIQGDVSIAVDLQERVLFTFGRTVTTGFRRQLELGEARLDFRRPENRQFWLACHDYIKSLIRRGAYHTALEWAKLALQLDLTDPYAIGFLVPGLAIKAKEFSWLVDASEKGLGKLHWGYLKATAALAMIRMGNRQLALDTLRADMQQRPWLYGELFRALSMDVPQSIWAIEAPSSADELYTALYIHFTKDLWNFPKACEILVEASYGFPKPKVQPLAQEVSLAIARLVFLEHDTGLLGMVPKNMLSTQPNFEFDPLPPPKEDNIFTWLVHRAPYEPEYRSRQFGPLPGSEELEAERAEQAAIEQDILDRQLNRGNAEGAPAGRLPQGGIDEILNLLRTSLFTFQAMRAQGEEGDVTSSSAYETMQEAVDLLLSRDHAEHSSDDESLYESADDEDNLPELVDVDMPLHGQSVQQARAENAESGRAAHSQANSGAGQPSHADTRVTSAEEATSSHDRHSSGNARHQLQATVEDAPDDAS